MINYPKSPIEVGLVTGNLDEMIAFYSETLQLQAGEVVEVPGRVRVARVTHHDSVLKLVQPVDEPGDSEMVGSPLERVGIRYLTLHIEDGERTYDELSSLGCVVPETRFESPSRLTFVIRDPDGNLIELLETRPV
jgi:catechol 2,3-dioxygenase-like lactoylglutathione lyase family enzyme